MNEKLRALFDEFEQHHGMPMDRGFLDKLEFTHDQGDKGYHVLRATHPEHGDVGSIDWWDHSKYPDMIYVDPSHRHKGVATKMWDEVKKVEPDIKQSWEMTPKGRDWYRSLGDEEAAHADRVDELSKSANQTRTCVLCRNIFDESEDGEATGFCQSCREKEGLVTHHSWSEDAQEGHYGAVEDDITKKTPAEIDTEYFPLAHRHNNLLDRSLRYNQIVNDPKTMDYQRQQYRDLRDQHRAEADEVKQQMLPHEAEYQRRGGWDRYQWCTSDGGHLHKATPTCHTLTPGKSQVSMDPDASGLDEPALVEKYGYSVCTHCFKGAPTHPAFLKGEAEAQAAEQAKVDSRCSMSGKYYSEQEHGKLPQGYWQYAVRRQIKCPGCGGGVALTDTGKFRAHKPPKTASKEALEAWALGGSSERSDEEVFEPLHRMVEAADPVGDRLHRGTSLSVNGIRQLREGIEEVNLPLTSWSTNRKVAEDEAGSYGDRRGVVFHLSPGARAVKNTQNKFGEAEYISKGKFKVNRIEAGDPYHVYLNPVTEKTASDKSKKRAIMAIGIPGSGKSTLLKPYAQALGAAYVSSDETRGEVTGDPADVSQDAVVWPRIYEKLHQALDGNDTVVFDSTASNYEKRLDVIRHLREKAGTVEAIHFDVPLDVAHERNDNRDRRVPPEIIDAMHAQLEANPPGDEFDSVQVVGGSNPRVGEDSEPDRGTRSSRLARKAAAMASSEDYRECRFCLGSGLNGGQRCARCSATGSEGTVPCQSCGNPLRAFEVFLASGPTCGTCVGRISA